MSRMCLFLQEPPVSKRGGPGGSSRGQACDVFICSRGPEVKGNLVSHIKERLQRANLTVFVDYEMRKGIEAWQHVLATLRGARGVLLMLTPGFEESPWCLEEARTVAARLDEARAAAAGVDFVLPVLFDREAIWDEGKLPAAFHEFLANRDFHMLRAEEPTLASDIVHHWRDALGSLARISYLTHSSAPRCKTAQPDKCLLISAHV